MAEELSRLAGHSLNAESMAATNTVSSNTSMTAPGSRSESTAAEDAGSPSLDVTSGSYSRRLVHGDDGGQGADRWDDMSGRRDPWP